MIGFHRESQYISSSGDPISVTPPGVVEGKCAGSRSGGNKSKKMLLSMSRCRQYPNDDQLMREAASRKRRDSHQPETRRMQRHAPTETDGEKYGPSQARRSQAVPLPELAVSPAASSDPGNSEASVIASESERSIIHAREGESEGDTSGSGSRSGRAQARVCHLTMVGRSLEGRNRI